MRQFAMIALLLAACQYGSSPPSTDAGADPAISGCCYLLPWTDKVRACIRSHSDPGQCRWLSCLDGLWSTMTCRPED